MASEGKSFKSNQGLSFFIIFAVYALAVVVGVSVYMLFNFNFWIDLLIGDVVATVFVFIFSLIFKNASVYDPYWSVQPPVILTAFAMRYGVNALSVCLLIAVWFWAIRLTTNWALCFGDLTKQDWRYTMLKEKTGKFYPVINFVGIHLVPTLVVYACILPAVFAVYKGLKFNAFSFIFCALSVASATLQCVADIEMHKFRKNRTGNFIRTGLWKYSRHPNYLGEICMWWGIGFAVFVGNISYWFLLVGALLNTLLFSFVSIPMAEGKQSKKEGYSEYRKYTRALFPVKKFKSAE